jgi:hypothetical protein
VPIPHRVGWEGGARDGEQRRRTVAGGADKAGGIDGGGAECNRDGERGSAVVNGEGGAVGHLNEAVGFKKLCWKLNRSRIMRTE